MSDRAGLRPRSDQRRPFVKPIANPDSDLGEFRSGFESGTAIPAVRKVDELLNWRKRKKYMEQFGYEWDADRNSFVHPSGDTAKKFGDDPHLNPSRMDPKDPGILFDAQESDLLGPAEQQQGRAPYDPSQGPVRVNPDQVQKDAEGEFVELDGQRVQVTWSPERGYYHTGDPLPGARGPGEAPRDQQRQSAPETARREAQTSNDNELRAKWRAALDRGDFTAANRLKQEIDTRQAMQAAEQRRRERTGG